MPAWITSKELYQNLIYMNYIYGNMNDPELELPP